MTYWLRQQVLINIPVGRSMLDHELPVVSHVMQSLEDHEEVEEVDEGGTGRCVVRLSSCLYQSLMMAMEEEVDERQMFGHLAHGLAETLMYGKMTAAWARLGQIQYVGHTLQCLDDWGSCR